MLTSQRRIYFAGFIIIVIAISFATYLQIYQGLYPCPLCIVQRIIMAIVGVVFFFGAVLNLKKFGSMLVGLLGLLFSSFGIVFAGRHVWIQYFSPAVSDCSMGIKYLFKIMSFNEAIKKIFTGGAECAKVDWTFLNLSLPEWSLICFILLFLLCVFQLKRLS